MEKLEEQEIIITLPCKKKENFTKQKEILVEVVAKRRTGKCVGKPICFLKPAPTADTCTTEDAPIADGGISYDIWVHISKQIEPEDVKTFSMICTLTSNIVNTKEFWLHLYRKFCANGGRDKWICTLPPELQPNVIARLSRTEIRHRVVESLFFCYTPFQARLRKDYKVDALHGQFYVSSWYFQSGCFWIISYKFASRRTQKRDNAETLAQPIVDDWESLAMEDINNNNSVDSEQHQTLGEHNPHEGISLLLIMTQNYTPVPTELLQHSIDTTFRLDANRNLLDKDMRFTTLELDFVDKVNKNKITIRHHNLTKYKVVPWWHPDFKVFVK